MNQSSNLETRTNTHLTKTLVLNPVMSSMMNRPFDESAISRPSKAAGGSEYLGYDHSNYTIPFIQREAVEFAYSLNVRSSGVVLEEGSLDRIQDESRTQIFVKESLESMTTVEIRGTRQQVLDALTGLKDSFRNDAFVVSERALLFLRVPPEMIGCLIGKAGKNIKSIKESSRVGIRVDMVQEKSQIQTVRIMGGIEEVLDAHQKVCDSLRTFDPKKSRMVQNMSESSFDGSVINKFSQFGESPSKDHSFNSLQNSFIIQTPDPTSIQNGSPILVLQSDGSYQPAHVVYQTLPVSGVRESGLTPVSRFSSNTSTHHDPPQPYNYH